MSLDEIIEEARSLPVDERARVVDSLLQSLNPPDPRIDIAWAEVANARLAEMRSGTVKVISVGDVFDKIRLHFPTE